MGRSGLDGVYRWQRDRRGAGPQRLAAQPVLRHEAGPGGHGLRGGRAEDSAARNRLQRAACDPGACSWSTRPRGGSSPTTKSSTRWPPGIRIANGSTRTRSIWPTAERHPATASTTNGHPDEPLLKLQRTFGYTLEDVRILMMPMATDGQEAIGSMGNDAPLAVLSDRPQLLYNYFKQLFAQVTNPPLDAIREEIITSMITTIGSEGNLLDETPEQCRLLRLDRPIVTNEELVRIKALNRAGLAQPHACRLCSRAAKEPEGMRRRLDELRREASQAIADGVTLLDSCRTAA